METALHDQLQAAEQRRRSEPMVMSIVRVRYADIEKLANSVRSTMQAPGATTIQVPIQVPIQRALWRSQAPVLW